MSEITIRNNIVAFGPNFQGMIRATSPTGITVDHNLIFGESQFPEEEISGGLQGDPLFVDSADGAPAFDIGAFEL